MSEWPPNVDLEKLALDEGNTYHLKLIEGLCRNAIDARSSLLCLLSAEDGEWSDEGFVKYAQRYQDLMTMAHEASVKAFKDPDWVVFAMMTKMANQMEQSEILPW